MRKQIVITGIPRSGTSYMASLLFSFSNTVILSEPPMLDIMHKELNEGARDLFDCYYERVVNKEEVPNLFRADGTLVEDTRQEKLAKPRGIHEFDNEDFIFGIKNTRTFLARLPGIIEGMPDARIVVLARNPFDTIGSIRRFAGAGFGPGIHKLRPYYKELLCVDILEMQESEDFTIWMWKFWTDLIMKFMDKIIFVRYQDLILKPKETLDRIFGNWNPGEATKNILPSEIRYSRDYLLEGDRELIEKYCKENAKALGLWEGV